jgi:hypothetical protein
VERREVVVEIDGVKYVLMGEHQAKQMRKQGGS